MEKEHAIEISYLILLKRKFTREKVTLGQHWPAEI